MSRKKGISKYDGRFTIGQRLTGTKWTVVDDKIKLIGKPHARRANIKLKCDCGFESYVDCWTVSKGKSKGCETCNNSRPKEKNPLWKGNGDIPGAYLGRVKRQAAQRNIEWNLTPEQLVQTYEASSGTCALTNVPISFTTNNASLDRIDSNGSYTTANVQWVHKDVNRMKNAFPQNYFVTICNAVATNHPVPQPNIFQQMGMKPVEDK